MHYCGFPLASPIRVRIRVLDRIRALDRILLWVLDRIRVLVSILALVSIPALDRIRVLVSILALAPIPALDRIRVLVSILALDPIPALDRILREWGNRNANSSMSKTSNSGKWKGSTPKPSGKCKKTSGNSSTDRVKGRVTLRMDSEEGAEVILSLGFFP